MTRVSAAIIKNSDNEIMICQRGPGGSCEFLWEFPGGKIEPGESPEECLVRECREELEIDIEVLDLFEQTKYSYPEREIEFMFFSASLKMEALPHLYIKTSNGSRRTNSKNTNSARRMCR